jgi:glutamate:GABA antiporter
MAIGDAAAPASFVGEKRKLRKVLLRIDLILFSTCAIITLETLASTSSPGGQAIVWLLVTLLVFFVPYGLIVAELGSAFPLEGGPYEWSRLAYGRLAGSVTAFFYWVAQPIWLGGLLTATAVAGVDALIVSHPLGTVGEVVFGLVFVWAVIGGAILAMRFGKQIPNAGSILKFALTLLFVGLAIAFLVSRGKPAGTVTGSGFTPSLAGFLFLIGILMYNWIGFETATGASEEMVNPRRDIPKMVLRGGAITAAVYALFLIFILLVIPKSQLSTVSSFAATIARVNSVLGGATPWADKLIGVTLVIVLLSEGVVWIMGSDRIQAIAAIDGAAPGWMRRFTSFGTPIAVNLTSGFIGSVFVVLGFTITGGRLHSFFSVMLSLAVSTSTLSYLLVFPALTKLRRTRPDAQRPFQVPGGMAGAWTAVILTEAVAILTSVTFLWPGLINSWFGQSYSMESEWGVSRPFFEVTTLGTLLVLLGIAVAFWAIGKNNIRHGLAGENQQQELPSIGTEEVR